ncbi:MAG: PhnD/SsuA/transferrin family substrate-binding protein [Verrucomicrobia bacterium]|nr:PhnD/SsuA/transferrin family substrate-binding protein [Verrucomicrobiota bacterium]
MKTIPIAAALLLSLASLRGQNATETAFQPTAKASSSDVPLTLSIGLNDIYCGKTACSCISNIAKRSYDGTLAALEKQGIKLQITYFMEVMDLEKAIREKKFDGVLCKPWTALRYGPETGRKFVRVADVADSQDSPVLAGIVVVPVASPIRKLADLQGKRLVFGQPDSYEKYHAPLLLMAKEKVKPASALYLSSCGENLDALMSGKVDAAVISDYALTASCAVDFAKPEDFRTIATTEKMPLTSLLVDTAKVSPADAARLQQALLAISGKQVPADLTGKGFVTPVSWKPEAVEAKDVPVAVKP